MCTLIKKPLSLSFQVYLLTNMHERVRKGILTKSLAISFKVSNDDCIITNVFKLVIDTICMQTVKVTGFIAMCHIFHQ